MGEAAVATEGYFEVRPRSKELPSRGTLSKSRPEAVGFHGLYFFLANLALFLLPGATYLLSFLLLGIPLGISVHQSPENAAYVFLFLSGSSGLFLLFLGGVIFPKFFRFHQVIPLVLGRRRHRSHFSFMSERRKASACGKHCGPWFTIFIMGLLVRSLPVVVTHTTTIVDIVRDLQALDIAPSNCQDQFYAVANGQKILSWKDTLDSLNIGPGSHLFFRTRLPGGSRGRSPSSSPSPVPIKKRRIKVVRSDVDSEEELEHKAKPKAPVRGRAGRRSHSGRAKRTDGPSNLGPASTPPPTLQEMPETPVPKPKAARPKKVAKFSPRTARTVAFVLRPNLPLGGKESDNESSSDSDGSQPRRRKPRALNRTKHLKKDGWRRVGSSHTTEVFQTFEQWHNDYTPHGYETADGLVEVKHLGHPVDRPRDIRARPFIVQWITPDRDAPKEFTDDPRPIFRVEYRCSGSCGDAPASDGDRDSDNPSDSGHAPAKEDNESVRGANGKKKYKKSTCPHNVVLHVEVYSDNLSKSLSALMTHWRYGLLHNSAKAGLQARNRPNQRMHPSATGRSNSRTHQGLNLGLTTVFCLGRVRRRKWLANRNSDCLGNFEPKSRGRMLQKLQTHRRLKRRKRRRNFARKRRRYCRNDVSDLLSAKQRIWRKN
ncbi:hypothetical protein C8F04DRAFT_443967 [Mycena alexandri]|uniref:Ubiquitin-like domain-containing protein n=1 Tax=Mycena alexandri TaxID=1745969 RepID=A0AAD6THY8_9AGAR|nr:hypothetical protein C8F04DRAFT_443967 [Mycena alexandri]